MATKKLYDFLAEAFKEEGVDTVFVLTGDGNMHWEAAFSHLPGTRSFHVRHEHCACAMASAYAVSENRVGVASVTCGPGLTQIMTALVTAVRARIPLVVFAGESPLHTIWYNQEADQASIVRATGAHYVPIHSAKLLGAQVQAAFHHARANSTPVVIGVPMDLQQHMSGDLAPYTPSTALIPDLGPLWPNPNSVAQAVEAIAEARRIVVIGGRGAKSAFARLECEALADTCGALLAHTLPVRGLFDAHPASIGIVGGFAHEFAREKFRAADLIVSVGASLSHHTVDGGNLFPNARVLQIDVHPTGLNQGRGTADIFVRGDAKITVESISRILKTKARTEPFPGWRTLDIPARMAEPADTFDQPQQDGSMAPDEVMKELDRAIPNDWTIVNSSGHCSFFSAQMRGRSADDFLAIREFGAIGNGLSYAIGVAAAKPDKPVVLVEGDGGFLMHIQELETVSRYNLNILFCILNDGAYGSEIHKLRADGVDDHGAMFGHGNIGNIARGFGLSGEVVSDLCTLPAMIDRFSGSGKPTVLDFHISDRIMSPVMRRQVRAR